MPGISGDQPHQPHRADDEPRGGQTFDEPRDEPGGPLDGVFWAGPLEPTTDRGPAPTSDPGSDSGGRPRRPGSLVGAERDLEMVRLAATPYRYPAIRAEHIHVRFGLSEPRFWLRIHHLIDQAHIEAALPGEVHRLRRLRDARAVVRRPAL